MGSELGFDNDGGFVKTRSHSLRKFFATSIENAGIPKNKVDFMLGHTPNQVDSAYFKTDIDKLKELYKKYLPYITFEKTIEIRSLDSKDAERLEALEKENQKLKLETKANAALKAKVDEVAKAYQEMIKAAEEKQQTFAIMTKQHEKMDAAFHKLLSFFPDNIQEALINGNPLTEKHFIVLPLGKKELEEAIERGKQQMK